MQTEYPIFVAFMLTSSQFANHGSLLGSKGGQGPAHQLPGTRRALPPGRVRPARSAISRSGMSVEYEIKEKQIHRGDNVESTHG